MPVRHLAAEQPDAPAADDRKPDVLRFGPHGVNLSAVIPGRAEGANPESITAIVAIREILGLWIPALALRARPD
jgi:hypothetical protein